MRILYDDQGFVEHHGGVSRYFTEIMKRLPDGFEYVLPLVSTSNQYLHDAPFNLPFHKQDIHDFIRDWCHGICFPGVSRVYRLCARLMPRRFPSGEFANSREVRKALKEGNFDVLHPTGPHWIRDDWKIVVGKKPIVITIHDLIPELLYRSKRTMTSRRQLLEAASHVIAVSENTKRDVIRLYGTPKEKISVIYHGYLPIDTVIPLRDQPQDPYVVYVGKRNGYKNFRFLVKAIALLLKNKDLMLFCTGSEFSLEERSFFDSLGVSHRIIQRFVRDEEMPALFKNAVAFVYPSLLEGFGIPILDAFSSGCPVILSRTSCFPEVAGNAALYFEKGDAVTLCNHVEALMHDDGLRQSMIKKGHDRVSMFSWEKCVSESVRVYANLG